MTPISKVLCTELEQLKLSVGRDKNQEPEPKPPAPETPSE